jgi:uncharacterized protein
MTSDNLKYVLRQFVERTLPACKPRERPIPFGTGKVIGLAGVRRSGKTFLFFDAVQRLAARGADRRRIVYLNFEDDRLYPIRAKDLDLILRCWHEVFPETAGQHKYLFLDEVQNVTGWERWVRRIGDTEDIEVFVTGSSSRLLTRDLATALRGRSITLEVFPLSFREYLTFRGIQPLPYSADTESLIRHELESYLLWGGFPEVVLADDTLKPMILEEYASLMLYRDVLERYGLRNEKLVRELFRHSFRNTASLLNVSKLYRDFTSQGLAISRNTLFEYLAHLEDSFVIFLLPRREASLRKQAHNPKKLHVIDTGLIAAFQAFPARDLGRKLETVVFLEIRRRRRDLFYYADGSEVDLCAGGGEFFINTCWSLAEPETLRRERAALAFGSSQWPKAKGLVLFHEYSAGQEREITGAQPAWRYLLGETGE